MRQNRPLIFWTRLIAVAFVATGRLLHADDQPKAPPGYHLIPIKAANGKTAYFQVKNQIDPFSNLPASEQKMFSRTNPMADQKFLFSSNALSKSDSDFKDRDQNSFVTKPYVDDTLSSSAPNFSGKAAFASTSAYSRNATGFDKSYAMSNADAGQNRTSALASSTDSTDQNRTAVLGAQTVSTSASAFTGKTFLGPEADAVHRHLTKLGNGQMLVTDLPNRPLTIDEVRDLINHGFKPNTDVKPAEPSKPLNDPDYKPEPLRDTPPPAAGEDNDKNDPVPPPGTMAAPQAPENSEPLPQP